jgi:hypothetical protein
LGRCRQQPARCTQSIRCFCSTASRADALMYMFESILSVRARPGVEERRRCIDKTHCHCCAWHAPKFSLSVNQSCSVPSLRAPMDPFAWYLATERTRRLCLACHITRSDSLPQSDSNRLRYRRGFGAARAGKRAGVLSHAKSLYLRHRGASVCRVLL